MKPVKKKGQDLCKQCLFSGGALFLVAKKCGTYSDNFMVSTSTNFSRKKALFASHGTTGLDLLKSRWSANLDSVVTLPFQFEVIIDTLEQSFVSVCGRIKQLLSTTSSSLVTQSLSFCSTHQASTPVSIQVPTALLLSHTHPALIHLL